MSYCSGTASACHALALVFFDPCVEVSAVEVNAAPDTYDRNLVLKDEVLNGLLAASEMCIRDRWIPHDIQPCDRRSHLGAVINSTVLGQPILYHSNNLCRRTSEVRPKRHLRRSGAKTPEQRKPMEQNRASRPGRLPKSSGGVLPWRPWWERLSISRISSLRYSLGRLIGRRWLAPSKTKGKTQTHPVGYRLGPRLSPVMTRSRVRFRSRPRPAIRRALPTSGAFYSEGNEAEEDLKPENEPHIERIEITNGTDEADK